MLWHLPGGSASISLLRNGTDHLFLCLLAYLQTLLGVWSLYTVLCLFFVALVVFSPHWFSFSLLICWIFLHSLYTWLCKKCVCKYLFPSVWDLLVHFHYLLINTFFMKFRLALFYDCFLNYSSMLSFVNCNFSLYTYVCVNFSIWYKVNKPLLLKKKNSWYKIIIQKKAFSFPFSLIIVFVKCLITECRIFNV